MKKKNLSSNSNKTQHIKHIYIYILFIHFSPKIAFTFLHSPHTYSHQWNEMISAIFPIHITHEQTNINIKFHTKYILHVVSNFLCVSSYNGA